MSSITIHDQTSFRFPLVVPSQKYYKKQQCVYHMYSINIKSSQFGFSATGWDFSLKWLILGFHLEMGDFSWPNCLCGFISMLPEGKPLNRWLRWSRYWPLWWFVKSKGNCESSNTNKLRAFKRPPVEASWLLLGQSPVWWWGWIYQQAFNSREDGWLPDNLIMITVTDCCITHSEFPVTSFLSRGFPNGEILTLWAIICDSGVFP